MGDELFPYLTRELDFLDRLAEDKFRNANPKIKERLKLGATKLRDPHVQMLMEGVAYLNARVRCKLDDDFPELTHALLEVLYPQLLAPIPAMAIAQFTRDPKGGTPPGYALKRGTMLETAPEPASSECCLFRTCYDVQVWPIAVEEASVSGVPLPAPEVAGRDRANSVTRIAMGSVGDWSFAQLQGGGLRFYLKRPEQYVHALYELLVEGQVQVALARSPQDAHPVILGAAVRVVGFEPDETLLPEDDRVFPGYRFLTEYFAFPHKFLFIEIGGLTEQVLQNFGDRLEIYIYSRRTNRDLENRVNQHTFALGCTPVVNLFQQVTEPIALTHERYEYRVVPDRRRQHLEVYSVDEVFSKNDAGHVERYAPFFGIHHHGARAAQERYWTANRRKDPYDEYGTELLLSFVNLNFGIESAPTEVFTVKATCFNRDLPARLPFGGGQPALTLRDGGAVVGIECLTQPTTTGRPNLREGMLWRLVSQLSLNHLSITEGAAGAQALKEILRLYDLRGGDTGHGDIDGIVSVAGRLQPGRIKLGKRSAVCQGLAIEVELDETRYAANNQFLFMSVLERFLNLYCSINSFTQLTVKQRREKKVLYQWPARSGALPIL